MHLPRGSSYRPAWRLNLSKVIGGGNDRCFGGDIFDMPADPAAIARALQNSEEENVEDIDLALRAITFCPEDARVCLQALKMIGVLAFRHPNGRAFLAEQAYDEILLAMQTHPDDEFIQGAAVAAIKYLTCGEVTGNDGTHAGEQATPVAPIASAEHFDLEPGKLFAMEGFGAIIEEAVARHPHNVFLKEDAEKVLSNLDFTSMIFDTLDIDGDGKIEDHELAALGKKIQARDLDGDGVISQEELVRELQKQLDVDGDGRISKEEMKKLQNLGKDIDKFGYVEDGTVGAGSRAKKRMPGLARSIHDRTGTEGWRVAGAGAVPQYSGARNDGGGRR